MDTNGDSTWIFLVNLKIDLRKISNTHLVETLMLISQRVEICHRTFLVKQAESLVSYLSITTEHEETINICPKKKKETISVCISQLKATSINIM